MIVDDPDSDARELKDAEALRDAYAGTLAKTGAQVGVTVVRHGFAPAGGGCLRVTVGYDAPKIAQALLRIGEVARTLPRAARP